VTVGGAVNHLPQDQLEKRFEAISDLIHQLAFKARSQFVLI